MKTALVDIGHRGLVYAAHVLEQKGDSLSSLIAALWNNKGWARVVLPSLTSESEIIDLNIDIPGAMKASELVDDAIRTVTEFIRGFVQGDSNAICIAETYFSGFDAVLALQEWPYATYSPTQYGSWDGTVGRVNATGACLFLAQRDIGHATDEQLRTFLNGPGRPGIVVLCHCEENYFHAGMMWSSTILKRLAQNALHVIVPAFGGESFIIWSMQNRTETAPERTH